MLKIAILGATGKLGKGLVLRFGQAGYPIVIGTRQVEKGEKFLEGLEPKIKNISIENYSQAADEGDIIIVSVPYEAQEWVTNEIREHSQGKIVISAIVPLNPTHLEEISLPITTSSAMSLQEKLNTPVVSAFTNVPSALMKDLKAKPETLVCGNDLPSCEQVIRLIETIGIRGTYAGKLVNSVCVEGLTSVLIAINHHYKTKSAGIQITR